MEINKYNAIVRKHTPKENILLNGLISFIIGGIMGVLGEVLVELYAYYLHIPTKEASTFMIITLVFLGCFLTCLGFFDKWVGFAKCGLIIPITGFAHSITSSIIDYKREGLLNMGSNAFKLAGSVILYGIVSAIILTLIKVLLNV